MVVEEKYALANALPHAEVHRIDRCGHLPQIEQVRWFNEVVSGLLADVDSSS